MEAAGAAQLQFWCANLWAFAIRHQAHAVDNRKVAKASSEGEPCFVHPAARSFGVSGRRHDGDSRGGRGGMIKVSQEKCVFRLQMPLGSTNKNTNGVVFIIDVGTPLLSFVVIVTVLSNYQLLPTPLSWDQCSLSRMQRENATSGTGWNPRRSYTRKPGSR